VPKTVGDRPVIHTGRHESRRMTVPQVVRANSREFQALEPRVVIPIPDIVLVQRLPTRAAEHKAVLPKLRSAGSRGWSGALLWAKGGLS